MKKAQIRYMKYLQDIYAIEAGSKDQNRETYLVVEYRLRAPIINTYYYFYFNFKLKNIIA